MNHSLRGRALSAQTAYRLAAVVIFLLFFAVPGRTQDVGGTISGTVSDSGGAVIPDAEVTIRNTDTGVSAHIRANGQGIFSVPSLHGGNYEVRVRHTGFKETMQRGIVLQIGGSVTLDMKLDVGAVSETVTVSGEPPAMDLSNGSLGEVVEQKQIEELPLNGRNTLALVMLTPGVRSFNTSNPSGFADRGSALSNISINGSPSGMNGNLLDGANNLQSYTGELSINPTVEAIQEFVVLSGTLSAEYGFTGGGIVNMSTRAGTNQFHGSGYEFLRNDAFDARNYFVRAPTPKPKLRYDQFGGALGGPIRRDRMFFFGNYEQFNYNNPVVILGTVPTPAERMGDFSNYVDATGTQIPIFDPTTTVAIGGGAYTRQQFPGNKIATPEDPVAAAIQNFYPAENYSNTSVPGDVISHTNNRQTIASNKRWMRQATGRFDDKISEKNSVFVRYSYYDFFTDNGGTSILTDPTVTLRYDNTLSQSAIIADTYAFSSNFVNEFRLAANRTYFQFATPSFGQGWPEKLGLPANVPDQTFPQISGNGAPGFQTTSGVRAVTNPQIIDIVTLLRGRHSLRFGVDWQWNRGNNFQTFNPPSQFNFSSSLTGNPQAINNGANTGSGYASFYLGAVASATASVNGYEAERNYVASGFIQDDWKITPYFTLNAGLRYDYQQQPVEAANGISNFDPNSIDPVSGLLGRMVYASVPGEPRNFHNEDFADWGPRLGFAWDVTRDGKTSLRGGFGIYYVSTFNTLFFGSTSAYSSLQTSYNSNDTNLPAFQLQNGLPYAPLALLGPNLGSNGLLGQSVTWDQSNGQTPTSQQYNLSIQRELPWGVVLEATYVGNHGVHMIAGSYNIDALNADKYGSMGQVLANQVPNPYAGKVPGAYGAPMVSLARTLLAFPYYGAINVRNPHDGNFHSDALELTLKKHMTQNFTLLATYTKSKVLDDSIASATGFGANSTLVASDTPQDPFARYKEYSLDPGDVSQRATVAVTYVLPFGRDQRFASHASSVVNAVIGGWQMNGIGTFQTGTPVLIQGGNNGAASRPNFMAGQQVKLAHPDLTAWFNPKAFVNPGPYQYGNVPRTLSNVRAPGYDNIDVSAFKNTTIYHNVVLQLRIEAFDVFNHPNFGLPNGSFSVGLFGSTNTNSALGEVSSSNDSRVMQLGAKLSF